MVVIDKPLAITILREEAEQSLKGKIDPYWKRNIETFSRLCEEGGSKTHIAFLGTVILAKSTNQQADLFAIKPKHSVGNSGAFSARSLCHSVLVPLSAEIGFSIGVTGREPLNNQPYFRMRRLDDGTPVHTNSSKAFNLLLQLVGELNNYKEEDARKALRAFIAVRKQYLVSYDTNDSEINITSFQLIEVIKSFVSENSENGRRAQAIVAGLLDNFFGQDRVESGRINDPSRKYPGDICIYSDDDLLPWEKAIEVRDKPGFLTSMF